MKVSAAKAEVAQITQVRGALVTMFDSFCFSIYTMLGSQNLRSGPNSIAVYGLVCCRP